MKWYSADGRQLSFNEIDQQYLSNIFYYIKYVTDLTRQYTGVVDEVNAELKKKI